MTSSRPSLPVLPLPHGQSENMRRSNIRWSRLVHTLRMILLAIAVVGVHRSHHNRNAKERQPIERESLLAFAKSVWPSADRCFASSGDELGMDVVDSNNILVGKLAQTSPLADSIVGYAGPSNLLIAISPEEIVRRVSIAHSADTAEHVLKVRNDDSFWKQFEGRAWSTGYSASDPSIIEDRLDGVSGATLTSLAMAESILMRIDAARSSGGASATISPANRNSLKFSQALTEEEALQLATAAAQQFPEQLNADRFEAKINSSWEATIANSGGKTVGRVLRSGPLADQILGYQGPSEVLLFLDQNQILLTASFRSSYDNEPYKRYVREEASFWSKFEGRSVDTIASMDLKAEGIEGVSGATMTSQAIAETIRESCQRLIELDTRNNAGVPSVVNEPSARARRWNLSSIEIFTIGISCLAIPWSLSRLRGQAIIRLVWQATCFVGIGWVSGNLLSLALFSGWIQGGVPWQLAPGLTALLVVAFGSNLFLKRNVYCDHVCPHGIAQQWLFKLRRAAVNPRTSKTLVWLERVLNASGVVAVFSVAFGLLANKTIPAAWLEPFDTYVWRVGLSWSAVVWVVSLAISFFRPMSYCRRGCPTGMILEFTRFNPKRYIIGFADAAILVALLTFAANW